MVYGDRKQSRVRFEEAIEAVLISVDGTWRRDCLVVDISASGARLVLKASVAGLDLSEFFLLLTPSGLAYRRCELVRMEGEAIGVRFLAMKKVGHGLDRRASPVTSVGDSPRGRDHC